MFRLEIPSSIHEQLKESMPADNDFESKYQLMFTMAQIPGIVIPIFAGMLVDKVEARLCILSLSVTCFIGHILASYGIESERYEYLSFRSTDTISVQTS